MVDWSGCWCILSQRSTSETFACRSRRQLWIRTQSIQSKKLCLIIINNQNPYYSFAKIYMQYIVNQFIKDWQTYNKRLCTRYILPIYVKSDRFQPVNLSDMHVFYKFAIFLILSCSISLLSSQICFINFCCLSNFQSLSSPKRCTYVYCSKMFSLRQNAYFYFCFRICVLFIIVVFMFSYSACFSLNNFCFSPSIFKTSYFESSNYIFIDIFLSPRLLCLCSSQSKRITSLLTVFIDVYSSTKAAIQGSSRLLFNFCL